MRISDWSSDVCSSDLFLAGGHDLARMDIFLGPAHFGNVDQTFDARFQFHESAIFGDVRDATGQLRAHRVFGAGAFPRIAFKLLHAQRNPLRVAIDADDLYADGVANVDHLIRRSEEHTSELQSLMRISYAVFCLKKKKHTQYN